MHSFQFLLQLNIKTVTYNSILIGETEFSVKNIVILIKYLQYLRYEMLWKQNKKNKRLQF